MLYEYSSAFVDDYVDGFADIDVNIVAMHI